jgi:hypothetical protein
MAQLTVKQLREALVNVPDTALVVFQANVESGEELAGEEPGYTTSLGYVYSVFQRDNELVIDGAITNSEL